MNNKILDDLIPDLSLFKFLYSQSLQTIEENKIKQLANDILNPSEKILKNYSFFDLPFSGLYKRYYKNITHVLQSTSFNFKNQLSNICKLLLQEIKTKENPTQEKKNAIRRKLESIWIITKMFENRSALIRGCRQPLLHQLDQFLSISTIEKIFMTNKQKWEESKAPSSIMDIIFHVCFKWVEKNDKLNSLSIISLIGYCKGKGEKLKSLKLKNRQFHKSIHVIIDHCPKLKKLELISTDLSNLLPLKKLVHLEELNLSNSLSKEEFLKINQDFPYLKILNLSCNQISSLDGLKHLSKLEELNLSILKSLNWILIKF